MTALESGPFWLDDGTLLMCQKCGADTIVQLLSRPRARHAVAVAELLEQAAEADNITARGT